MNKKWIEISFNILFWIFSSWLIIYSFSISYHMFSMEDGIGMTEIRHSKELIHFFTVGQPLFVLYFYAEFYLIKGVNNQSKILSTVLKAVIISLLFLGLYYLVIKLFFQDLQYILWFPSLWYGIFIFYTTIAVSYGLIKAWSKMEQDKRFLEVANKQAELHLLRSQLHPHFLFNTLNNLLAMVDQKSNPKLARSIDKLSGLLRYVVYENKRNLVPVAKEIEFLQNFSELHLLRFEENEIDFDFRVKGAFDQQEIEMGILLSFVENAFKHGVQPEFKSFVKIEVDLSEKQSLTFKIKNSMPPKLNNDSTGGYGLQATKERLALAYPDRHSLTIDETGDYYFVELNIRTHESTHS